MTGNRRPKGPWVPLQANYMMDEAIMKLTPSAELVYIRGLALCKLVGSDGYLSGRQVDSLWRGIRRKSDHYRALLEHKLWLLDATTGHIYIRSWKRHNPDTQDPEVVKEQARARQQKHREINKAEKSADVSRVTSRSLDKRREEREESLRSTGTERSDDAPAAPRDASGAAQPPLDGEVVTLAAKDAQALARAEIEKGRKNNPAAGRQFSYRAPKDNSGPSRFREVLDQLDRMAAPESGAEE